MPRLPRSGRRATTWALFALALLVRLLFWQATPDRAWPHSALYKGDAIVWTDYAAALAGGGEYELGLPLRPPGNAYLLSWLGVDGRAGAGAVKLAWCLLGALAVALFHAAARAAFGPGVALAAGLWCALSTALLMLSTSLNNETPYLVLVGALVLLAPRLAARPTTRGLALWGALHGLASLVRVEHLLFALCAAGWLAWAWRRDRVRPGPRRLAVRMAIAATGFAVVLLPWHVSAWRAIHAFNTVPRPLDPAAEAGQRGVERATAGLQWTAAARAERDRLPAFARRAAANFVAATVLVRGGRRVEAEDLAILEEGFGSRPRPLSYPLVALYGPLNFHLAHRDGAPPGFDPAGLDRPPPLAGGAARYPRALVAGLPPPELNFSYPPHVEVVTDGYRLGLAVIAGDPGGFVRRAGARLDLAWRGAALGWTGYGLPWGLGGTRRAVDLTVPESAGFAVWRGALLLLCAAGAWRARREPVLALWLLYAGTRLAAAGLFFGYARHGATLVPVVAVLGALALAGRLRLDARRGAAVAAVVAIVGLGTEVARWADPPAITVDGRTVGARDPVPAAEHRDRRVELR